MIIAVWCMHLVLYEQQQDHAEGDARPTKSLSQMKPAAAAFVWKAHEAQRLCTQGAQLAGAVKTCGGMHAYRCFGSQLSKQ
jgi:hypothetical protein